MNLGPGIYCDIPHATYLADPCKIPTLSASVAQVLNDESPKHAWQAHPRLGGKADEEDDTEAKDRGTIVHKLLLGRGPDVVPVEANDWRTKIAKEARDAARAAGQVPVLARKLASYRSAAQALEIRLLQSMVAFQGGKPEVTVVWESDGVLCRARMDYLRISDTDCIIDDVKTCESANPCAVGAKMVSFGADIQAAAYVEAMETLRPELAGRITIRFDYVECRAPHEVSVNVPSGAMLELGRHKWRQAKETWRRCNERQEWPGYPSGVHRAEPPPWALSEDMERQMKAMENSNDSVSF